MHLVRLIYSSKIVTSGNINIEIENILNSARHQNAKTGITGLLCFSTSHFFQCLEGSRNAVSHTYQKILLDERHTDIQLIDFSEIATRDFSDWGMAFVPQSSLTKSLILEHSINEHLNPQEMGYQSIYQFMKSLKTLIPVA